MELLESGSVRPRQARYQAALRPDMKCTIDSKALSNLHSHSDSPLFAFNCAKTVPNISLNHRCARIQRHLVRLAVDLLQGFSLHLQLHLRILLEDFGVTLPKQLCHPFVRDAAGTEPSCIRGAQIVNPKVGDLRSSQESFAKRS